MKSNDTLIIILNKNDAFVDDAREAKLVEYSSSSGRGLPWIDSWQLEAEKHLRNSRKSSG